MDSTVEFGVLGPVEARIGGRAVLLGGPRARAVLAALLLDANHVVPVSAVVLAAWGCEAPDAARFQAQNRISNLRRALREAGGGDVIQTAGTGYVIRLEAEQLDALRFDGDVRAARRLLAAGDLTEAARTLAAALRRWRGPALHGLLTPRLLAAAQRLDEARLTAQELLVDIDLRRGRHHEVIGPLLDLTAAHPWREGLAAQLILALYRAGRRREALEAYEATHRLLVKELGIDPGQALIRLRDRILRDDPALLADIADPAATDAAPIEPAVGVHLLPRAVPQFVGRRTALESLDTLAAAEPDGVAVCTITGPPGVGKTALAVHWAHRTPAGADGRLFVNLRAELSPAQALTTLLSGLGTPPDRMPPDEAAAVTMYRSLLAGRRVVVVLDNAASADQVRPLLPPGPGSVAIVTSRDRLIGLTVLEGARPLLLPALAEDDAVELLHRLIGAERIAADGADVVALARLCGRMPIALRMAAAQLGEWSGRIGDYVADLRSADPLPSLALPG